MSTPSIHIRIENSDEHEVSARIEHGAKPATLPTPHLTEPFEGAALPRPTLDPTSPLPGSAAPLKLGVVSKGTTALPVPSAEVPGLPTQEIAEDDPKLPKPY